MGGDGRLGTQGVRGRGTATGQSRAAPRPAPTLFRPAPDLLDALRERGDSGARKTACSQLQQAAGNRAVQRILDGPAMVQRSGDGAGEWGALVGLVAGLGAAVAVPLLHSVGLRDENQVTNILFWARHPSMAGRKIARGQADLARDWLFLRNKYVRPIDPKRTYGDKEAPAIIAARVVIEEVRSARRSLSHGSSSGAINGLQRAIAALEAAREKVLAEAKWMAETKGSSAYLEHAPSKPGVDRDLARLAAHLRTASAELVANQDKMRKVDRFEIELYSDMDIEQPPLVDLRFEFHDPRFESMMHDAHQALAGGGPFWDNRNDRPKPNPTAAYRHLTRVHEYLATIDTGSDKKRAAALTAIRAHLKKVDKALAASASGLTNAPPAAALALDLNNGPLPDLLFAIGALSSDLTGPREPDGRSGL